MDFVLILSMTDEESWQDIPDPVYFVPLVLYSPGLSKLGYLITLL